MSRTKSRLNSLMTSLPLCMKPHEQFMSELQKLSRHNRQNALPQPPCVSGHRIDLQKLYNEVAIRGGHKQVTVSHQWTEVYLALGLPPGCVDAGHGLRTIYQRYLELYERNQRMMIRGPFASDDQDNPVFYYDDLQDLDQTVKLSRLNTSGTSLRCNAEEIPNHLRESWNLSTELKDNFEYTSLEQSLLSGLPNEVELALNTILLMSSQPNCFSIYRNPRLLDVLLNSVGVSCPDIDLVGHVSNTYAPAQSSVYQQLRYLSFWESNVDNEDGRVFLSPTAFSSNFPETVPYKRFSGSHTVQEMTYGDEEAFRVQLVATVLRNLAVDDILSAVVIGRNPQALRFIFLCIYAKHSCLHQLGLEILSSLCFPVLGSLTSALHRLLTTLLVSPDRIGRIRGLQIVKNLCTAPLFHMTYDRILPASTKRVSFTWTDRNIAFLTSLPPVTYSSIASTLCLKDLHLVVLAVDAVYSLTCLGPSLCDHLLQQESASQKEATASSESSQNASLLPLLVSLLNLEAQAMGSDSLIRVRVMQALGTESNAKSSVSKPSAVTPPSLTKVVPSTAQTTAISYFPSKDSVIMCTSNSAVQLPIHCSQPNITLSLNQPSHCASQRSSVQDTSSKTSTGKTLISVPQNNRPFIVSNCHSYSTGPIVSVTDSATTGSQTSHSSRVNKRDLLVRSCLPVVANPRANYHAREVGTIMHSTQQNPGSASANKPALSVIQTSSSTLSSNVFSVSNSIPCLNDLKSKVCLPQQTCATLLNNTPITTSSEIQKQTYPSSKLLTTENGIPHLDRREFMFEWLKSNYAVHNHSSIPRIQIYNEYQKAHLQRFRNIGAVSPVDFHSQIKTIFPGVGQVKVQVPGGSVEIHYNNLKHVNAPEPESQQGINDIMASVLSPNKTESVNHETRTPKNKCRKRVATGTSPHSSCPKLASKIEDTSNHVFKNSRVDVRELNGHLESLKLTNGQLIHPLNGLSRDTNDVTNNINSTVHNGSVSIKPNVCTSSTNEDSCIQKRAPTTVKSTAVVSLPDSKIVIVPVFTTYSMGHNLTLKGLPTNETPVTHNIGKSEISGVQNTNETFTSTYCNSQQSATISKVDVNAVKSATPPLIVICNSDLSLKSTNYISSTVTSDNINGIPKIPVGNIQLRCKWDMCGKEFSESSELWSHFQSIHYETVRDLRQVKCAWENCSELILNATLDSLLSHFNSKHGLPLSSQLDSTSNNDHSKAMGNTSQSVCEISNNVALNPSSCEIEKPLVYDELDLSSILSEECRRALTGGVPNPPFAPTPVHEGPVTKHLRLTAALALRNLLKYTDVARCYLRSYENILCDLAFANLESSPTILECLTLLSNPCQENSKSRSSVDFL